MNPTTKQYLKVFLQMGVPSGLMMLIFDLANGEAFSFWKLLFFILFFGIAMTLTFVPWHKSILKDLGVQKITDESWKTSQSKIVSSSLNQQALIQKLKSDPTVSKMKMTEIENGILLKSGVSGQFWGEKITIILNKTTDTEFEYQVASRPKLKSTIFDFGKNLKNIVLIERLVGKT